MRRQREADAEKAARQGVPFTPYEPIWFNKIKDEDAEGFDNFMHVYKGTYWEAKRTADWKKCPKIF